MSQYVSWQQDDDQPLYAPSRRPSSDSGGPATGHALRWAKAGVEGAKDLLLDVVDTILGIEYEEENDLLPTSSFSEGGSDGDSPRCPAAGTTTSSGNLVGSLFSVPRLALQRLHSLLPKNTEESLVGSFDCGLPRTSQQAHRMSQPRARPEMLEFGAFAGGC